MIVTTLRGAFLKSCNDLERGILQASFIDIIEKIASLGKARRQGGSSITIVQDEYMFRFVLDEFWMVFGVFAAQICAILVLSIGTSMVVSVPIPLWKFVYRCSPIGTGTVSLWYRYLYMGIGTDRLRGGMVRPRRSVRGGGQAPEHSDEVEIEQGNEESLPVPPVSGEVNIGGAGLRGSAGPQVAQGPGGSTAWMEWSLEDCLLELVGLAQVRDRPIGTETVPRGTRTEDFSLSIGVGVVTPGEAARAKRILVELPSALGVVGATRESVGVMRAPVGTVEREGI
ncbi:hypothetical protein V6N11_057894 [Hibiscus sabdariffa]|uniref:Uncharacterized protein n=1 Tax=Hibiscus sabdariffa TaxID=183260 RepID=A0ABR2P3V8_9ROSI